MPAYSMSQFCVWQFPIPVHNIIAWVLLMHTCIWGGDHTTIPNAFPGAKDSQFKHGRVDGIGLLGSGRKILSSTASCGGGAGQLGEAAAVTCMAQTLTSLIDSWHFTKLLSEIQIMKVVQNLNGASPHLLCIDVNVIVRVINVNVEDNYDTNTRWREHYHFNHTHVLTSTSTWTLKLGLTLEFTLPNVQSRLTRINVSILLQT